MSNYAYMRGYKYGMTDIFTNALMLLDDMQQRGEGATTETCTSLRKQLVAKYNTMMEETE